MSYEFFEENSPINWNCILFRVKVFCISLTLVMRPIFLHLNNCHVCNAMYNRRNIFEGQLHNELLHIQTTLLL